MPQRCQHALAHDDRPHIHKQAHTQRPNTRQLRASQTASTAAAHFHMHTHTYEQNERTQADARQLRAMQAVLTAAANRGPEWLASQLALWSNFNVQRTYPSPGWPQGVQQHGPGALHADERAPYSVVRVRANAYVILSCVCLYV
jgi:hypothetical protein